MSMKLFRHTGYSTILLPGETRVAPHPAWVVAGVSAWIALACNVALWRALLHESGAALASALALAMVLAGASGVLLSTLCWRRTLKPVACALLVLAAATATSVWVRALPIDRALLSAEGGWMFPGWASLLGWQVPSMLALLGLMPVLALWSTPLRRLAGPEQLRANLAGMGSGGLLLIAGMLWLELLR